MTEKTNIKACLFDLDGVVIFTDKYHYLAWKGMADSKGWNFDEEVNEGLRGVSRMESLQIILDHNKIDISEEEKISLATKKNDSYVELLQDLNESDIFVGVVDFLKNLKEKGVRLAICSSSRNARFALNKLDLMQYFDVVVDGNDISKSKPDPEVFTKAAVAFGLDPKECIVFEDAESGVEGALAGGMHCIGVGKAESLPKAKAVIENYANINIDKMLETALPY